MTGQGRALMALVLVLPVGFVAGHLLSAGAVWNHATGEGFSPWRNWVSDYAYRSPAWPLFVGCMHGFAILLAAVSLRVFRIRRGPLVASWLTAVLLGYGALKLVEVALFPVKPPEVRIEELQARMDRSSWERVKEEAVGAYRRARGWEAPRRDSAAEVVAAFESNTGHLIGIRAGMAGVLAAMGLALLMPCGGPWRIGTACCLGVALVGGWLAQGELRGLFQRLAFVGIYGWLALAVVSLFREERAG